MAKVKIGSLVMSRDGHEAGEVDRVVLDPRDDRLTHIVVRAGQLLTRDVVVPIEDVEYFDAKRVVLKVNMLQLESKPDYFEADFVSPPPRELRSSAYEHGDVLLPVTQSRRIASPALFAGKLVECTDGVCGAVEEVQVDPVTGQALSFRVHPLGTLTRDLVVPIEWVLEASGNAVRIDCNVRQLDELLPPIRTAHERMADQ